jgi:AAA+ superfamily predicted ATPase
MERSVLFEKELELPDAALTREALRLVGFRERYDRLRGDLRLLLDREGTEEWSKRFYDRILPIIEIIAERYPLVVFHGDVGTGKTVTAEASANELTKEFGRQGMLFKLSTRVRGEGRVGQMSLLINEAFGVVIHDAGKQRLSFLIIDEGDSVAGARSTSHSHHEDKVGVNTLVQKLDDVRRLRGRVLTFLCTYRFVAVDPAIVRRAGRIVAFARPTPPERETLLRIDCEGLGLSDAAIDELVRLTGPDGRKEGIGFTYSDIRTRLLPESLARAFPDRALNEEDLFDIARAMEPSPRMGS